MSENRVSSMIQGDLRNAMEDFSVDATDPDGIKDQKETRYTNTSFSQQWAYYIEVTDIQEVIDAKWQWVVGKGFTTSPEMKMILDGIRGNGRQTFNTILENLGVTAEVGEDSYAHIIRADDGTLINLKPLDTGRMTSIWGRDGLIKKYEYNGFTKEKGVRKFKKEEIFHLQRNHRLDETHGRSMIDVLTTLILAKQEAIADQKVLMHWHVKPRWKHKLKDDDPATIAAYKVKQEASKAAGDDIYEPFDVAESEIVAVPANATLNPMAWINYLDAAFYKAAGVPQFIVGGGTGFTEASEIIAYLAWQQKVEKLQLYIEEQVGQQLGIEIELEFPASLENELLSDNKKDGAVNVDQAETSLETKQ